MSNKYGIPLMIADTALKAMFNSNTEEREISTYVSQISEDTAKLKIHGPLIKYGSWWSDIFGISAYSSISKEFKKLASDPNVKNIILDIDSPGGMVNGCSELAETIYRAREDKHIISYVSGQGCSAAYYLASAASKIYAHKMATVGSIGVVACFEKSENENTKIIEIVSSKSKDKRLDVETAEGQEKIQTEVDDLADIFMEDVSRYRDISLDDIEKTNGGTFIGKQALEMKLVDEISDLETILKEFDMSQVQTQKEVAATTQVDVKAVQAEAITAERTRVATISAKAKEFGVEDFAQELIAMGTSANDAEQLMQAAKNQVNASKEGPSIMPTGFEKEMEKVDNPEVKANITEATGSEESVLKASMLAMAENIK